MLNALKKEIFELTHDQQHHASFHKTYDRIITSIYIKRLSKNLRIYINHYPKCELNQIKRYKPYKSIIPINKPGIPFHIIIMDFVITLPVTTDEYNCLFIVTNKFSKRVLIIPGRIIYNIIE